MVIPVRNRHDIDAHLATSPSPANAIHRTPSQRATSASTTHPDPVGRMEAQRRSRLLACLLSCRSAGTMPSPVSPFYSPERFTRYAATLAGSASDASAIQWAVVRAPASFRGLDRIHVSGSPRGSTLQLRPGQRTTSRRSIPTPPTTTNCWASAFEATSAEITRAYREAMKRFHPDRVAPEYRPAAESICKDLNRAYSTLSNPVKRVAYDRTIRQEVVQDQIMRRYTGMGGPPPVQQHAPGLKREPTAFGATATTGAASGPQSSACSRSS